MNDPKSRSTDSSRIRYILYETSPIPLELLRECIEVFRCGFVQICGMTETVGTIAALPPEDQARNGRAVLSDVGAGSTSNDGDGEMVALERILVATDFSPAGSRAVRAASHWAHRMRAVLRIVHVAPAKHRLSGFWSTDASTVEAAYSRAASELQRLAEAVDPLRKLDVSTGLLTGRASEEVARAAAELNGDLIVIGARGEHEESTEERGVGGTALRLVETTERPLLLVRKDSAEADDTVLAAVDLSPSSAHVLDWASLFAASWRLHALHVYEVPYATRLAAYGFSGEAIDVYGGEEREKRERQLAALIASLGRADVQNRVERGDAAIKVSQRVRQLDARLVTIGKRTRRARSEQTTSYGSVCRYVTSLSPSNVLVVPP